LTGRRFGRLVIVGRAYTVDSNVTRWRCRCDCGNSSVVSYINLVSGNTRSCGCLRSGNPCAAIHGRSYSRIYRIWGGMLRRCRDTHNKSWIRYGGRGITICSRWRQFIFFLRDMGECPPGFSIERIDNSNGYGPGNCKWASPKEQARNRRDNHILSFDGKRQCLQAWAEELNIHPNTLRSRLSRGWSVQDALTRPDSKVRRGSA
jgi:hypothetical protein